MKAIQLLIATVIPASAGIISIAHPATPLAENATSVWTPLFQAAWDDLNKFHGGKPVAIDPPNKLISRLDRFAWDRESVMPPSGSKSWAGPASEDFLRMVNFDAAKMTLEEEPIFRIEEPRPGSVGVFALLNRKVVFEHALQRAKRTPMQFRHGDVMSPVQFFGVRGSDSGETGGSIRVLGYRPSQQTHALEIKCRGTDETVILFRPPHGMAFEKACLWIRTWRSAAAGTTGRAGAIDDPLLHEEDMVRVPYVSLSATHDFGGDLASARTYSGDGVPWSITVAQQKTEFRLHESGAEVRAEVILNDDPFGPGPEKPPMYPRRFHYDAPFFVFLWREKAEWPYFGAWIGDASALKPMEP